MDVTRNRTGPVCLRFCHIVIPCVVAILLPYIGCAGTPPAGPSTPAPEKSTGETDIKPPVSFKDLSDDFLMNFDPLVQAIYNDKDINAARKIANKMNPIMYHMLDLNEVKSNPRLLKQIQKADENLRNLHRSLDNNNLDSAKIWVHNLPATWHPINWWIHTGAWPAGR